MEYAVKINGKYFKEYVYAEKNIKGRFGKVGVIQGDIIDLELSDEVERTFSSRCLGGTLATIYLVEKFRDKKIEIIPLGRN